MIDAALGFMKRHLDDDASVFVYCSLGESRSPSIALMYMLEHGLMEATSDLFREFKERHYANYQPKRGNAEYILNRWLRK